ncbi:MAG: HD domain-containing protein [Deltaproteobacteria bacterium]|nr:HD domain-containing protein [Deltaproteobacteria bacterium]MCB2186325.1 HD domain-containing protein [Deltaproteobacteria bacterium]
MTAILRAKSEAQVSASPANAGQGPAGGGTALRPARRTELWFYKMTPLYVPEADGGFKLFKEAGVTLAEMSLTKEDNVPEAFIQDSDRPMALREIQKAMLDGYLQETIRKGDQAEIKEALTVLLDEAFREPRLKLIMGFQPIVETVVEEYASHPKLLAAFAALATRGLTVAAHSVNVMALVMAFCFRAGLGQEETCRYCFGALLHDLGWTKLPPELMCTDRRLNEDEFSRVRQHPLLGVKMLVGATIAEDSLLGILQHHERMDGSGYPKGVTHLHPLGSLLGLVDSYEVLTCEERVYRKSLTPLATLELLKSEVLAGKFERKQFERFAYSLVKP